MERVASIPRNEVDVTEEIVIISVPTRCPGCDAPWDDQMICPRCGLSRSDVAALLRQGCDTYEQARAAAIAGRYAEVASRLRELRGGAIPALSDHAAVRRLAELCAVVNSCGEESTCADYEAARRAAHEGDWPAAAAAAARAVHSAPSLLPARKLHLLCLYAAGHTGRAERFRRELLAAVPGDVDLARWQFSQETLEVHPVRRGRGKIPRQRNRPPTSRVPHRSAAADMARASQRSFPTFWLGGLVFGGFITAVAALGISVAVALRQPPAALGPDVGFRTVSPSSLSLSAPRPSASPDALVGALPTPIPNGFEAVRHEAAERQARVWFNAAVRARREGRLSEALALADTAYRTGSSTYLADEALLLRAQCADNLNYRTAAEWYARVAEEQPRSAYAPLTLLLAARVARRQGRPEEASLYLTRLWNRYPRSPQAVAQRMDLSSIGESSTTNVHGQRQ